MEYMVVSGADEMQSVTSTRDGEVLILTIDNPPVNALSWHVRNGIGEEIGKAVADDSVKAIVLICAGRTFIAGADISEMGNPNIPSGLTFLEVFDTFEHANKPIIAAIHGSALGGGFELALVCHYRIAVPSAQLGLPEVKLGLIPGAGGTQRLPRVVGIEQAAIMVSLGEPISAVEGHERGLVDRLAEETSLRADAITFARECIAMGPRSTRNLPVTGNLAAIEKLKAENARKWRGFEAPYVALKCVEFAAGVEDPEDGLRFEREAFVRLREGTQTKAQRHMFFAERQAAKVEGLPKDTPLRDIRRVGVVGAGTMGGGIAMNFLQKGIPVALVEQAQDNLDRGVGLIRKNYEALAAKGSFSAEQVEQNLDLLSPSLALEDLSDCDLVIEAVYEVMDVKQEVFAKLDRICKPGAILATNTSYLDVNEIASATSRPQDVLGMHFFSPANVMKLLEVVRGDKTSDDALATVMALAKRIGKIAVVAGVCHGFIGNRMLAQRQHAALQLLLEGASPEQIDRAHFAFGMPMGPFQMSDLAGLDVGWHRDPSRVETIRDALCAAGRLGQKNGKGFYDYDERRNGTPSPETLAIIEDFRSRSNLPKREITDEEIIERTLYPMVNEGHLMLEEGKAQRASDIDVVWVHGYGWPAYRGGPMHWGEQEGASKIAAALEKQGIPVAASLKENIG
ncbi:3-hydroxyacyl-CoA dehydrogenase NAD-binding domain-containing protein [Sphingorhabdus lacus]